MHSVTAKNKKILKVPLYDNPGHWAVFSWSPEMSRIIRVSLLFTETTYRFLISSVLHFGGHGVQLVHSLNTQSFSHGTLHEVTKGGGLIESAHNGPVHKELFTRFLHISIHL